MSIVYGHFQSSRSPHNQETLYFKCGLRWIIEWIYVSWAGQVEGEKKENRKFRLQIDGFALLSVLCVIGHLILGVFHPALSTQLQLKKKKFYSVGKMLIICINRASTVQSNLQTKISCCAQNSQSSKIAFSNKKLQIACMKNGTRFIRACF